MRKKWNMLSIIAAAALAQAYTAPVPTKTHLWYRVGDTPHEAFTFGQLTVGSVLIVRPDGSVQGCKTSVSSRYPHIDHYTCRLLWERARFAPARGADGTPMYGVFRTWTQWGRLEGDAFDFELTVDRLPAHIKSGTEVDIMFLVSAEGSPSFCTDQNDDDDAALVELACRQLARSMVTPPVLTEEGVAVPSVQDATVRFVRDRGR